MLLKIRGGKKEKGKKKKEKKGREKEIGAGETT